MVLGEVGWNPNIIANLTKMRFDLIYGINCKPIKIHVINILTIYFLVIH